MCPHTPFGNVKTIKQHYQCRTEQRIAQEVCGHVHQYGRIRIFESNTKEEMYRIICRKQQHSYTHNLSGAEIILENFLSGVFANKNKSRRITSTAVRHKVKTVYRWFHCYAYLILIQSYENIGFQDYFPEFFFIF